MDKISSESYLEIISLLTSSKIEEAETLKELFCSNIMKVYKTLKENEDFKELLEYLNEKFPNLASSPEKIKDISDEEIANLFVEWNLFLLEMYSLSLTKEIRRYNRNAKKFITTSPSPDTLSPSQKKSLWCSVDFIVVLGISIYLDPGVGLPLFMKSKASQNIQSYFALSHASDETNFDLFKKSLNFLMDLYQLKLSTLFKDYIITHHFNSYISALFQISYGYSDKSGYISSNKMQKSKLSGWDNLQDDSVTTTSLGTDDTTSARSLEVSIYREYLNTLILNMPLKFIFKELILLIGGSPLNSGANQITPSKTPRWLLKKCSAYIRECLMMKSGIQLLIPSLIDECLDTQTLKSNGRPVSVDWNKCDLVARIITNCPLGSCSREKYYSNIAVQIMEIIQGLYYQPDNVKDQGNDSGKHVADSDVDPKSLLPTNNCRAMMPTLVRVLEDMLLKEPNIFHDNILNLIIAPLKRCVLIDHNESLDDRIVDEKDLSLCLETLHEIIVIFYFPGSMLGRCLLPYLNILFQLYVFASSSVSYLRSTVEALVHHIFNHLESKEIAAYFSLISNLDIPPTNLLSSKPIIPTSNQPSPKSPSQLTTGVHQMDPGLHFALGSSGGIRITKSIPQAHYHEVKTLEQIENKSMCISKLIVNCNNEELAIEIFLMCLKELTKIISKELNVDMEAYRVVNHLYSNLDFESLSRNILLLTLLGNLVEKLDHLCLKNIEQIFFFAQVTMERSIHLHRSNFKSQYEVTSFQEETLSLVIALLATVLLGHEQITAEEWTKAGSLLPSLRYLSENHKSQDMRLSSFELMKAILTHGKLLNDKDKQFKNEISKMHLSEGSSGGESSVKFVNVVSINGNNQVVRMNEGSKGGKEVCVTETSVVEGQKSDSVLTVSSSTSTSSSISTSSSLSSSSSSHEYNTFHTAADKSTSLPNPIDDECTRKAFEKVATKLGSSFNQLPTNDSMFKNNKPNNLLSHSEATTPFADIQSKSKGNHSDKGDNDTMSPNRLLKAQKFVHFSLGGSDNEKCKQQSPLIEDVSEDSLLFNNELLYLKEITHLLDALKSSNKSNNSCIELGSKSNADEDCSDNYDSNLATFTQMLIDCKDEMIPVRGHGLLSLRKLVENQSSLIEKHKNLLLKICRFNIQHEDSYIYLNAIYAMSVLTTKFHCEFLQILINDYVSIGENIGDNLIIDKQEMGVIDVKLKMGEALLRVVTNLGDMAVTHKEKLLSAYMAVSCHKYSTVRSSAIMNLGQLCHLLRFALTSNIQEIFAGIKSILKYDMSIDVRRAAAMVTHQILKGTSKDTLLILGDVMADFYRLLKDTHKYDRDDVVKLHAQLSIEELNAIMKNFLFPASVMEKNIFILNPPPNLF